ncbi:ABC transporter ATP-binding protein [Anaerobaca lacustris]|uniref:ABC transporter ATP-binding protein n=1 Tax=Anaerobaca lacustris TaxID=3044600 RepID=A0AAW6TXL5_9BACT|nr:ABC transporter ATP-binding protein [Sedimentisphaerales bacterium M17dextr]
MKNIKRLFGYVWPQWPRVVGVVVSTVVIALLLSVSFMAIIPLLTVMIQNEGLHGWADRKTCETAYGMEFDVLAATEVSEDAGPSLQTHLRVHRVREDSLAEKAGIRVDDRIGRLDEDASDVQGIYPGLLEELATAAMTTPALRVRLMRRDGGDWIGADIELSTPQNTAAVEDLNWRTLRQFKWRTRLTGLAAARWAVGFLPRGQSAENRIRAVVAIMVVMLVITIIRCIAKYYQDYVSQKIVQVAVNELRQDVFTRLTCVPISIFATERPSDTISRIMRDTNTMTSAIKIMIGKALREPVNALFMLAGAMFLNWRLSLIFLTAAPLVLVLLASFGRKIKKASRRSLVAGAEMLSKLQEAVAGLRVVKVYNQQRYEQQRFAEINDRLLKQLLAMSKVDAATHPVLEVLGMLAGAGAIVVGMAWVTGGGLEGPEFIALLALLGGAAEAVRKTSGVWNRIQQANAAAERVFDVLDHPPEPEKPDAVTLPSGRGDVDFRDVVFTYPVAEHPALKGVRLTVTSGHNVAIVGPNGSGKTTLANLLPRFYDPDSGRILIGGYDIAEVTLESLRSQIGMVTQEVITFNDTITANIAYGRQGATQEEIVEAARRAFAHEFISQLPLGYNTVIGEYGVGLSGGQLQRIVIARAILKNPAILIFDEATSQVDADSEAKIHKALEEIMQGRTTFIIAHRFSTVIAADVIVVMDGGRIVAQGKHEQLMQTCPIYQGLYETQLIKA